MSFLILLAGKQSSAAMTKILDSIWDSIVYYAIRGGLILIVASVIWFVAKHFLLAEKRQSDEHGTAKFSTLNELKKLGVLVASNTKLKAGELILGNQSGFRAILPAPVAAAHTLVIGRTGSGKTYTIMLPNIIRASNSDESLFITDVKKQDRYGELWEQSSKYRRRPIYFSPLEPQVNMMRFNIIPAIRGDEIRAQSWARAVVGNGGGDSHWETSAVGLLMSIWFHAATTKTPNLVGGQRILLLPTEELKHTLENSPSSEARAAAAQFLRASEKEASGILSSLTKACSFLNAKPIREFCWRNTATDFSIIRRESMSIYYQARINQVEELKPLNSLILTYMTDQLIESNGLPVKFLLDEFANFGKIPGFEQKIATWRSAKLPITAILQSHQSQLKDIYGEAQSETILSNFTSQIALPGLAAIDAEPISKQLGVFTGRSTSESHTRGDAMKNSATVSTHAQPLMTPDQIARMPEKSVLVFRCGNADPFIVNRNNFSIKRGEVELKPREIRFVPEVISDMSKEKLSQRRTKTAAKKTSSPPPVPVAPKW